MSPTRTSLFLSFSLFFVRRRLFLGVISPVGRANWGRRRSPPSRADACRRDAPVSYPSPSPAPPPRAPRRSAATRVSVGPRGGPVGGFAAGRSARSSCRTPPPLRLSRRAAGPFCVRTRSLLRASHGDAKLESLKNKAGEKSIREIKKKRFVVGDGHRCLRVNSIFLICFWK
ncbi:hypothetical protein BT93_A1214 [Corymbia citriodora subsp. variegata]|nr:hypothetical protein BT93_A1214 [Corymbia citriodora subsp. variegata]